MRNHRIHLVDTSFLNRLWIGVVGLQIDGICPVEVNVEFDEMPLLSVTELLQVKHCYNGSLVDGGL